jgi:ComF family protein
MPSPPNLLSERGSWRKLAELTLDLLYPSACAACRVGLSGGRALCGACDADLPRLRAPFCKICGEANELGRLAYESFADPRLAPALAGGWPLVPVPLHRKRQQDRHFNQAEEISRVLARHTGLTLLKGLHRTRPTETQTLLTRAQRLANLRGAFEVTASGHRWLAGKSEGAILVDDVLTTGSTVDECAKTLRRGGFKKVFVVTVMRG